MLTFSTLKKKEEAVAINAECGPQALLKQKKRTRWQHGNSGAQRAF
jgi:hypothetical protein